MSTVPPPPPVPKTSGTAIASLVLGICSLFCSIITALPAVICGIIALVAINKEPARFSGRGQAITGIVLGGLGLLFVPIAAALVIPAFAQARGHALEAQCLSNARQIGTACMTYEMENNGRLPRALADLDKHAPGVSSLRCPVAGDGEASYELAGLESTPAQDPGTTVLLRETEPRHRNRRAVVFADGHVEMQADP